MCSGSSVSIVTPATERYDALANASKSMTSDTVNDNNEASPFAGTKGPDAHGQAALLLVESLIHALIARSVINVEEAIEVVDIAADVKEDIAEALGEPPATLRQSLKLLQNIAGSLRLDLSRS